MADPKLAQDYERVLESSRSKGEVLEEPGGGDRRKHPRIKVQPGALPVELDPWVFAIDISISGMAFYADEAAVPGLTVTIALGDHASVEAEVVGCRPEPPAAAGAPPRYRLHCKFADEEAGMRLLVAIKELEGAKA